MFWNSLYANEVGRKRVRKTRMTRDWNPPKICIPILCTCTPKYACQSKFENYLDFAEFIRWCKSGEAPTKPADPLSNIRMQKAYAKAIENRNRTSRMDDPLDPDEIDEG